MVTIEIPEWMVWSLGLSYGAIYLLLVLCALSAFGDRLSFRRARRGDPH